jgi:hypothetical protein
MQSWGQSGKVQLRAIQNMGRIWQETYPVLDASLANVRALLVAINQGLRDGVIWQVQHPYWHVRAGVGGGTPLVMGAGQSGSSLIVDGAPAGQAGWLLPGDMITVTGGAVVFDVTAPVNVSGGGVATIPITPPIFVGQEPGDNAPVEIDPTQVFFDAVLFDVSDFPAQDVTRYIDAGMTLTFRETP